MFALSWMILSVAIPVHLTLSLRLQATNEKKGWKFVSHKNNLKNTFGKKNTYIGVRVVRTKLECRMSRDPFDCRITGWSATSSSHVTTSAARSQAAQPPGFNPWALWVTDYSKELPLLGKGVLPPLQRINRRILQPHPTGQTYIRAKQKASSNSKQSVRVIDEDFFQAKKNHLEIQKTEWNDIGIWKGG